MACFPGAVLGHMHHALCTLPAAAAYLLQAEPQLVGAAVDAWCTRGPGGMQQAARLRWIPPQPQVLVADTFMHCPA